MNSSGSTVIIGIDPGLRSTGWGVIGSDGNRLTFVAAGTVHSTASLSLACRLAEIHSGLCEIIARHSPDEAAVETTFVNASPTATLKLGQARGAALLAPAIAGIPVLEYAPNAVKKAIVGSGHGAKQQIQLMVTTLMPRAKFDSEHAADALAIAICHAHSRRSAMLVQTADRAIRQGR